MKLIVISLTLILFLACKNTQPVRQTNSIETDCIQAVLPDTVLPDPGGGGGRQETLIRISDRRDDLDTLISDTLKTIEEKFEQIYGSSLFNHKFLEVGYLSDALFSRYKEKYYVPLEDRLINNYEDFRDSLRMGRFGLDTTSFIYGKEDTLEFFKMDFGYGGSELIVWDPAEWGSYSFVGYLKDGFYWLSGIDHSDWDEVYDALTGRKSDFAPYFSPGKKYYFNVTGEWEYGDIQSLFIAVGSITDKPFLSIYYDYYPFLFYRDEIVFGLKDGFWISDNEFAFCFYNLLKQDDDTLFYDKLNVRISINTD
ncbi:MAG: hypothetical protein JW801_10585 [Bacteroidales bacterium]|nr:hypothetical protein [Bacteroidales bacterium]